MSQMRSKRRLPIYVKDYYIVVVVSRLKLISADMLILFLYMGCNRHTLTRARIVLARGFFRISTAMLILFTKKRCLLYNAFAFWLYGAKSWQKIN